MTGARRRLPLLGLAAVALVAGIWTGLVRLGFALGPVGVLASLPLGHHAALMVSGFLGTLIGIERAVALDRRWAWSGPVLSGLGAAALLAGMGPDVGHAAMVLAAAMMTAVMTSLWARQPGLATAVMAVAPVGWLAGNLVLLAGGAPARAVAWWAAFLLLTIAGERLILSRLVRTSPAAGLVFGIGCALSLGGPALSPLWPRLGAGIAGTGWLLLAAWLLRFDVAPRRARAGGLPRFVAAALVGGYAWLGVAGLLALSQGIDPLARSLSLPGLGRVGGFALPYDATLHALFLGFVFSMIFAHAPIVLPAVLGRRIGWRGRFWVHLLLLHGSVAVRVVADLTGDVTLRSWAGAGNALAIGVFAVSTALVVAAAESTAGAVSGAGRRPAPRRREGRAGERSRPQPAGPALDAATAASRRSARG